MEATIPGKCAAPPAPAIITEMPRLCAFLLKSYNFSGVLCAETISTSVSMSKLFRMSIASCITGKYDFEPLVLDTDGCNFIIPSNINDVKYIVKASHWKTNKYEAGTMATAQVIAFDQSIKFLEGIGIDNVMKYEADLVEYGQELLQKNNSVKLIGSPNDKGGVLSFTIEGIHPHDIATILDEDGVAIRAGHHCCQILHDKLNIPASARASVGIYNTKDDLDKLNDSINNCKKIFNLK